MKWTVTFLLTSLLSLPVFASQRKLLPRGVDAGGLEVALRRAGFNIDTIVREKSQIFVLWGKGGESKDPEPIIAKFLQGTDRDIYLLARKWRERKITPEEKDELLRLFVLSFVGIGAGENE